MGNSQASPFSTTCFVIFLMTGGQWESMESWHLFGCSKSALSPLKGRVNRLGENCWRPSEWWSEISNYIRCLLKEQQMRSCGFSNPLGNTAKWKQNHLEPFPRTVWSLGRKDDLLKIASCLWRARVCRIFLCWMPGFNHCHSQEKGLLSTLFLFLTMWDVLRVYSRDFGG